MVPYVKVLLDNKLFTVTHVSLLYSSFQINLKCLHGFKLEESVDVRYYSYWMSKKS